MTDNMTHLDFRNTSAATRFSEIVCNKNETAVMMTFAKLSCWHVQQQQSTVNCEHYLIDVSRCPSGNGLFFLFAKRYISFFLYIYVCESGCVCVVPTLGHKLFLFSKTNYPYKIIKCHLRQQEVGVIFCHFNMLLPLLVPQCAFQPVTVGLSGLAYSLHRTKPTCCLDAWLYD